MERNCNAVVTSFKDATKIYIAERILDASILSSGKIEFRNKSMFTAISTLHQGCKAFHVFANVYGKGFRHCQTSLFRYTIARTFSIEAVVKYDAAFFNPNKKAPTLP